MHLLWTPLDLLWCGKLDNKRMKKKKKKALRDSNPRPLDHGASAQQLRYSNGQIFEKVDQLKICCRRIRLKFEKKKVFFNFLFSKKLFLFFIFLLKATISCPVENMHREKKKNFENEDCCCVMPRQRGSVVIGFEGRGFEFGRFEHIALIFWPTSVRLLLSLVFRLILERQQWLCKL